MPGAWSRVRGAFGAAAIVALAAATTACSSADAPPPGAPAAGAGTLVYVSNERAGTVVVLDGATGEVKAQIPVGKRPRGIKLSRDGSRLLVALSGSPIAGPGVDESTLPPADRAADGIGVVDLAKGTLVRTYPSGQDPEAFDLSPDGRTLYVSNEETAEMSVVDLEAGTVTRRVPVGEEPEGVTVSPDGSRVYVTCEGDDTVAAVDTRSFEVVARIPVAARPRMMAVTADGRTLFVTGENASAVSVVDTASNILSHTIQLPAPARPDAMPPRPMGVVLSPDGTQLFVSNGRATSVSVIDVRSRTPVRLVDGVGTRPWGLDISPDGRTLFTANGPSGDVSFIDVRAGTVDRRVQVGGSPWGVVVGRGN